MSVAIGGLRNDEKQEVRKLISKISKEYKQVKKPNIDDLRQIVREARGDNRTMAAFANNTELSASTLSRILNGKITEPLSIELMAKVYVKRDPSSTFTLEDLIRANGMISVDSQEYTEGIISNMNKVDSYSKRSRMLRRVADITHIIRDSLFARGLVISLANMANAPRSDFLNYYNICRNSDMSICIDNRLWCFDYIVGGDEYKVPIQLQIQRIINYNSMLFLIDSWEPEAYKFMNFSFVFVEDQLFDAFVDKFSNKELHINMTAILIDEIEKNVVTETVLGNKVNENYVNYFEMPLLTESNRNIIKGRNYIDRIIGRELYDNYSVLNGDD